MRKRILLFLAFVSLITIFRGPLYRNLFVYRIISQRELHSLSHPALLKQVDDYISNSEHGSLQLKKIADITQAFAADRLYFEFAKAHAHPDAFIHAQNAANCIGYSALTAAVCSKVFTSYETLAPYEVEHAVAQIYFLGKNIHGLIKNAFFQDHDIVILRNTKTGEQYACDPSLYDYFRISQISLSTR